MLKWLMSGLVACACAFGVYLLTTGLPDREESANGSAPFTVPEQAVDAEGSEQIYKSMCISCHGDQLQGKIGPELAHIGNSLTKEELFNTLKNGKGRMPSFKTRLSEEEIITITTWLASKK